MYYWLTNFTWFLFKYGDIVLFEELLNTKVNTWLISFFFYLFINTSRRKNIDLLQCKSYHDYANWQEAICMLYSKIYINIICNILHTLFIILHNTYSIYVYEWMNTVYFFFLNCKRTICILLFWNLKLKILDVLSNIRQNYLHHMNAETNLQARALFIFKLYKCRIR